MTRTALVTGASAGLGREFCSQLAAEGWNLVIVARDETRLNELARELEQIHGVSVNVLPADLLTEDGLKGVEEYIQSAEPSLGLLVNNAGFGLAEPFGEGPLQPEVDLLKIHTEVPLRLTYAALSRMVPAGEGRIINVASVAGFAPGGTYAAAKGWAIRFTRWANARFRRKGVKITALCPGFVHTEFHERMGASPRRLPRFLWLNADDVVREGLAANASGRPVSVPSVPYRIGAVVLNHAPKNFLARMAGSMPWERMGA